ncbi:MULTISPECIES: hypothetical protein [Leuconostoc]|jgi:hypothetical protein|uniref:hypothetical protein n=1 Tax=Leuconostoc TaxID=1243 RepID=UPI000ED38DC3|nr:MULTISPECIES: hypothetical protein [Leuconostoc]MCT4388974.1 hypothetical protein [Leuconostoc falkenbergense]NLT85644.1 hypothetical protein [Leuconostoc sp.]HCU43099.1 hypothetical protein [Leuconostoc pseudomesenteroides]
MSRHIYANLAPLGWVDLSSDPDAEVSQKYKSPNIWWSEGGELDTLQRKVLPDKLEDYPFVNVSYRGNAYRVSPFDFQIVSIDD